MEKNRKELASRLSYEIVRDVAPDELDLFDDFKEEFLKNPDAFLEKDAKKREKMLGFALPAGTEEFITTVVIPVVWGVIKKYLGRKEEEKLGNRKMKELRDDAYSIAISLDMDKEKAELLADSLVGKLAQLGS